jgi:hypothetical protein
MASSYSLNGAGVSSRVPFGPYYSQYYPGRYSDASLAKILPPANTWAATSNSSSQAFQEKGHADQPDTAVWTAVRRRRIPGWNAGTAHAGEGSWDLLGN